jgi:hypothetical protein
VNDGALSISVMQYVPSACVDATILKFCNPPILSNLARLASVREHNRFNRTKGWYISQHYQSLHKTFQDSLRVALHDP